MNRFLLAALSFAAVLSGCSKNEDRADRVTSVDIKQEAAAPAPAARQGQPQIETVSAAEGGASASKQAGPQPNAIPVSVPRIAYVYEFGYRLAADGIPNLQRKHADLCEKQGPTVCRILDMRQSGAEGDYASGSLALAVAAPRARSFGVELGKLAGESGGEEVSSGISGEDLSKQIVDTEARLRARTTLRDRLMEVLETRKGSVAELVEAERAVAQVNEEIDQARGWLIEMQGRVDFSRVNLSYNSGSPAGGGFMEPIRGAVGSIGTILGLIFAAIIVALTVLIPLGLIGWGLRAIWRRLRRPGPIQTPDPPSRPDAATDGDT